METQQPSLGVGGSEGAKLAGGPGAESLAQKLERVSKVLRWKVPVELESWKVAGSRKLYRRVYEVDAPSRDRAEEIVHSTVGALVGLTIETDQQFQNPKNKTDRFELYRFRVLFEEIVGVNHDESSAPAGPGP